MKLPTMPQKYRFSNILSRFRLRAMQLAVITTSSVLVLSLGYGVGYYIRYQAKAPERMLTKAIEVFKKTESFQFVLRTADDKPFVSGNLHDGSGNYSEATVFLADKTSKLEVRVVANTNNVYVGTTFDDPEALTKDLTPVFGRFETYQLLEPVIEGKKYVHLNLLKAKLESQTAPAISPSETQKITQQQYMALATDLGNKLRQAVIYKGMRQDKFNGTEVSRMSFGFDKDKLLKAIDTVKNHDVNVSVRQINALKHVVESTNDWGETLVELYIKDEAVIGVVLYSPDISESALRKSFEESGTTSKMTDQVFENIKRFLSSKPAGDKKVKKIATLEFTDYGKAPAVQVPTDTVDAKDVYEKALIEIGPMFVPLFLQGNMLAPEGTTQGYSL